MSDTSSVRVGIVGCGNIGHLHAHRFLEQGAELVGGVDISPEARERFVEEYGVETFEDHQKLFRRVDAVAIATPNRFHEEYAVDALEAGLDVLVEKPLAHSVESAERIAEAEHGADGFCMVGFHTRFENDVEVLKNYSDAGRFGALSHVEADYVRRRGIPGRGTWFTIREVAGGGALIDIGIHAIDLSLYLLGYPDVEEVSGVTRSQFGGNEEYNFLHMWGEDLGSEGFDVEDSATAFIRCAGDQTISLEVSWAANRPPKQKYVLRGTDGGATYDRSEDTLTLHETSSEGSAHNTDANIETGDIDAHQAEQKFFLEHVAAGTTPDRNTVDQALTAQRVIDGIYRASESGSAVEVDD